MHLSDAKRIGRAVGVGLLVCLVLSVMMHVTVFVAFSLAGGDGGSFSGEDGLGGAGGDTVEIAVGGPELFPEPQPGVPPAQEATQETAAQAEAREEAEAQADERAPRERVYHEDPVRIPAETEEDEREEAEPEQEVAAQDAEPAPESEVERAEIAERPGPLHSGTGAPEDQSGRLEGPEAARSLILGSAGFLPGSVAEQRAMLPERRTCDDPVAGVWRAHKYNPLHGDWAVFTLHIEREGTRLRGKITSRGWTGSRFDSTPPPCRIGMHDYTVEMRATGFADGHRITFGARSYRIVHADCPSPFYTGYNPDRFSGTIDPEAQEFESVNNDGGRDINSPYLFRRIGCDPDE